MTSSGYHAAEDGSLTRSTGGAAARGAMLIALALIIGLLLVMFALDDPQTELAAGDTDAAAETADADGAAGDNDTGTEDAAAPSVGTPDDDAAAATETIPPIPEEGETVVTDPPVEGGPPVPTNEVTVLVANGRGTAGAAGGIRDVLVADGYTAEVSNAPATASGVIFYRPGFDGNAIMIGEALGAAPDAVLPAPDSISVDPGAIADGRLDNANVIVIIGSDESVPPA